jgi:hypothetical protein
VSLETRAAYHAGAFQTQPLAVLSSERRS